NAVTNTPIIRPVVTMDKLEIIDIAQEIDTFEISSSLSKFLLQRFKRKSRPKRPKLT
ncbi:hypothetical protein GR255_26470, partial [Mycobacterium tuberculosis]|nr:hypothetical protein [Mycobacterium tuberculosis]